MNSTAKDVISRLLRERRKVGERGVVLVEEKTKLVRSWRRSLGQPTEGRHQGLLTRGLKVISQTI